MLKILSLDISSTNIGYALANWDKELTIIAYGTVSEKGGIRERIYRLAKQLMEFIQPQLVDCVLLEAYYGHGTKGANAVPEAKGAVMQEFLNERSRDTIFEGETVHSSALKGVLGKGNADKKEALEYVNKIGIKTDSYDCADAIINLLWFTHQLKNKEITLTEVSKENKNGKCKKGSPKGKISASKKYCENRNKVKIKIKI